MFIFYLLIVLRYIHPNPLAAGLVRRIEDFTASSYAEYIGAGKIIARDFILGILSEDIKIAITLFEDFMNEGADEWDSDIHTRSHRCFQ